jgi:hypothetical protein
MKSLALVIIGGLLSLGCHRNTREDRLERAGDDVEQAADKAGDKVEDAAENAGDAVEDATDKK